MSPALTTIIHGRLESPPRCIQIGLFYEYILPVYRDIPIPKLQSTPHLLGAISMNNVRRSYVALLKDGSQEPTFPFSSYAFSGEVGYDTISGLHVNMPTHEGWHILQVTYIDIYAFDFRAVPQYATSPWSHAYEPNTT